MPATGPSGGRSALRGLLIADDEIGALRTAPNANFQMRNCLS